MAGGCRDAVCRKLDRMGRMGAVLCVKTDELLDLLEYVFDKYENGPQCYEDPEDCSGFLGHAIRIGDVEFQRIADILNAHRPQTCNTAN
jgi:hypothetical protein